MIKNGNLISFLLFHISNSTNEFARLLIIQIQNNLTKITKHSVFVASVDIHLKGNWAVWRHVQCLFYRCTFAFMNKIPLFSILKMATIKESTNGQLVKGINDDIACYWNWIPNLMRTCMSQCLTVSCWVLEVTAGTQNTILVASNALELNSMSHLCI